MGPGLERGNDFLDESVRLGGRVAALLFEQLDRGDAIVRLDESEDQLIKVLSRVLVRVREVGLDDVGDRHAALELAERATQGGSNPVALVTPRDAD